MLLRLRDLLYPHSTGLELRYTCNRVKRVIGQRVGCTFRVVERDEGYTFLDVGGDPCTELDLSAAGDSLDNFLVLDVEGFCILGVHLDPAGRFFALETLGAASHGTSVPLPDTAPGGEDERVVLIRHFSRVLELDRGEDTQSVRVGELLLVQDRCPRVLGCRARPVQGFWFFQPCIVHAAIGWCNLGDFRKYLFSTLIRELLLVSHVLGKLAEDLPVGLGFTGRVLGLSPLLDTALGVGLGPVLLSIAGSG